MSAGADFLVQGRKFTARTDMADLSEFEVRSVPRPYKVTWSDEKDTFAGVRSIMEQNTGNVLFGDRKVFGLHAGGHLPSRTMQVSATEEFKALDGVTDLIDFLMKGGFTKGEKLVVVGGGIMEDVGAFAGAVYKRGIRWCYFPTTLLSMCDSCIGGKTGINHAGAKNQLALFSAPAQVVINPNFLRTLDKRDCMSGMGEILKLFVTGGPHFMALYKSRVKDGLPSDFSHYKDLILSSLSIKRAVVEYDEFELDHRRSLNYGHTVGHVVEALSGYAIPHGQAVSIGMIIVNELAVRRGLLGRAECDDIKRLAFEIVDSDSMKAMRSLSTANILDLLQKDKKAVSGSVALVLIKTAGDTVFVKANLDAAFKRELDDIVKTEFQS